MINFNQNYIEINIKGTILSLESESDRKRRSNLDGLKAESLTI